jgi:NYN domain
MNPQQTSFGGSAYYPPSLMLSGHSFVDGAYFREEGKNQGGIHYPNPHSTIERLMSSCVREMGGYSPTISSVFMRRMYFYDATDPQTGAPDPNIEQYWDAIEKLHDTEVRFGAIRGSGRRRRQKAVDVQLTVYMLTMASNKLFDVAILIAGDEDFVPLVHEVQRRGISVVVAAVSRTTSAELRRIADRYVDMSGPDWWTKDPLISPAIPLGPPPGAP